MEIRYAKRFLKDLADVPENYRRTVEEFVFKILPHSNGLRSIGSVEQMQGYGGYFKVRFGQYRVGLQEKDGVIVCERILHRKEIYRFFP